MGFCTQQGMAALHRLVREAVRARTDSSRDWASFSLFEWELEYNREDDSSFLLSSRRWHFLRSGRSRFGASARGLSLSQTCRQWCVFDLVVVKPRRRLLLQWATAMPGSSRLGELMWFDSLGCSIWPFA